MRQSKTGTELEEAIGLRAWEGHPARMDISHRHNDLELNLVVSGSVTYFFGGRRFFIPAQTMVLFWATAPHQLVETSEDTMMHWLTLPLAWFLHQKWPEPFRQTVLNAALVYDRTIQAQDPLLFVQWQHDLAQNIPEYTEIVYLEVEARLRRMAVRAMNLETGADGAPGLPSTQATSHYQTQAEKMAGYLAGHFQEDLTVQQVSGEVGLHPNYAMNVFRKAYGQTIIEYLTQCRVAHAQQMLVTTGENIIPIALQSGFGSVSQFYSAFKRQCGMSPRAYRESLLWK